MMSNRDQTFAQATRVARHIMADRMNFTRRTDAMGAVHAIFMQDGYNDAEARVCADVIVAILAEVPELA